MKVRLMTVDGHMLLCMGLARMVSGCPDIELVGEAQSRAQALELATRTRPGVAIVGSNLPDGDGIRVALDLRGRLPDLGVVLLTVSAGDGMLFRAMDAGLSAQVTKSATAAAILAAVRHAAVAPHTFTAPDLAAALRRRDRSAGLLSERETQVLAMMRDGMSSPEMAALLRVAPATVKTYTERLYHKLKVRNRSQALVLAAQQGLLDVIDAA